MPELTVAPDPQSGLNDLYVLYQTVGVQAEYTASTSTAPVKWYRYSQLGGGYAEEIQGIVHAGNKWTLPRLEGDMGYIIEEGSSRYYCWVADYSAHPYNVSALAEGPESDCDRISLIPSGKADEMVYYSINGRRMTIDRGIRLIYDTQKYDADRAEYTTETTETTFAYLTPTLHADAPLCATQFRLVGDRFLQSWGMAMTTISPEVQPTAVRCETTAEVTSQSADNEQTVAGSEGGALGGSAPVTVDFHAAVTDAAIFREWQFSRYEDFSVIDLRYNQLDISQTFLDQGSTYVRFMAANDTGDCSYAGPTYTVFIGDSALEIPNAFSPDASEGVNDIWKVSYKSLIEFECHIFNRYGTKMKSFTDPADGWDGKYNGKYVPAGVYYYVIKAKGADGQVYNRSGDINIIKYK